MCQASCQALRGAFSAWPAPILETRKLRRRAVKPRTQGHTAWECDQFVRVQSRTLSHLAVPALGDLVPSPRRHLQARNVAPVPSLRPPSACPGDLCFFEWSRRRSPAWGCWIPSAQPVVSPTAQPRVLLPPRLRPDLHPFSESSRISQWGAPGLVKKHSALSQTVLAQLRSPRVAGRVSLTQK